MDQFPLIAGKVWWSNSFIVIKDMVLGSDIGWAYLPKHLVEEELNKLRLVEINVSFDHKTWSPPVDLVKGLQRTAPLWQHGNRLTATRSDERAGGPTAKKIALRIFSKGTTTTVPSRCLCHPTHECPHKFANLIELATISYLQSLCPPRKHSSLRKP